MARRLGFGALFLSTFTLAACSSGGGSVTSPNPLNPTPAGTGTIAPTTAPSGGATATPTPGHSAAPSSSPSAGASATPTPAPSASSGAGCPPSYPASPSSETVPLAAGGGMIALPSFADFTGNATTPAISNFSGQTATIMVSNQNFVSGTGYSTTTQPGTPVLFTSLAVNANVTFAGSTPMIMTSVTAPCEITPGHTYNVGLYAFSSSLQQQTNIAPSGNTLNFTLTLPIPTFPNSATGYVVITQN